MAKKSITPQDACDLLNGFLELDNECAQALLNHYIKCNKSIEDHPSIQVTQTDNQYISYAMGPMVRFLGLLNGMFGANEYGEGPIVCTEDEDGNIINFFTKKCFECDHDDPNLGCNPDCKERLHY